MKKGFMNICLVILCFFALLGALSLAGISRALLRDTGGTNGSFYSDVTSQLTLRVPLEFSDYTRIMKADIKVFCGCQCPSKDSCRHLNWILTVSDQTQVLELVQDTVVYVSDGSVPYP